ncbi:hypothetical protein SNE40_014644 [Patella caerulea]|uniref:BTB domain-containing protein n=2 Tax=Patella caerulea TaxID=87958 RepID=A0AAN8JIF0_PATCE
MFSFLKDEHTKQLRLSFRRFFEEGTLTDITINVSGKKFKCHRVILASMSVYYETLFSSNFKEATQEELTLPLDTDCDTFEEVLQFIYCVTDTVDSSHAEKLFQITDFLQINSLKSTLIEQLLYDLDSENCLEYFRLADLYNCPKLLDKALAKTAEHFEDIVKNDVFLLLRSDLVCNLISKTYLSISSEEKIFEAIVSWYHENEEERKEKLSQILNHIRFPQMAIEYLSGTVAKEKFMKPLQRVKLIAEAEKYHTNPHLRHTYSSIRTVPRHHPEEVNMFCIVGCQADRREDGSYSQTHPTVHMFDLLTTKWYKLNYALHEKLLDCTNFAVCPYNNGIFISGGPKNCKGLSFLDVRKKVLSKRRQMNTPRMFHCLVAIKFRLYAIGGKNLNDQRLSSVEMLDTDEQRGRSSNWQNYGRVPVAVSDMTATFQNQKIYIFGGFTDSPDPVPIQCFDTETLDCYLINSPTLPERFVMPKCVLCDNRIIVVCGDGCVYEFFGDESRFKKLGQIQVFLKKHYFGLIQYTGCVFVFGGVGSTQDVVSFDLRTGLTKYHSHFSPITCTSVYGGFFTSTKLSGLTPL